MTANRRGIERSDLVRIRWPMEPAFRPDGDQIAYVVSGPDEETDRVRYWLHVMDRRSRAVVVAKSVDDIRSPLWSPRGGLLACAAASVIGLVDDSGEVSRLRASPRGVRLFGWSPDGRDLIVVASGWPEAMQLDGDEVTSVTDLRREVADEIWLVPVDGGESRRLPVGGITGIQHIAWSPGRTKVALTGRPPRGILPAQALAVLVLDVESGDVAELVPPIGPVRALAWSPAGDRIAYLGHESGGSHAANFELRVVTADGSGRSESISSEFDRSVGQVVRGDDERGSGPSNLLWTGEGILAACAFGGSSSILRFGLDGSRRQIVGGERAILGFDVAAATGELAFVWSDDENPGELSTSSSDGSEEVQCGDINGEWLAEVDIARAEHVTVVAGDGVTVEGWLTTPPKAVEAPFPLVLQVHGGPHYPVGNRFSFDAQRLAAMGIAVLRANPRGAQGYGAEFSAGITGDWGGRDFADLQELLDVVVRRPDIEGERLAIVGESYGGFMVNWALGHDRRFVAGIAENGIANLAGVATGRMGLDFWHDELGRFAWEAAAEMSRSSPLFSATSVSAPLLLIHAEGDTTVPIEQSEAMYVALASLGADVRFYRIPGEQHWVNVLGTPSRRLARLAVFDSFLIDQLVKPQQSRRNGDPS